MADEAVIVTLLGNQGDPVEYTCSATTAIAKGELLKISNSSTVAKATAASYFAGIAASEKTATDGVTKIAVITHCVALLTTGAAEDMTFGEPVMVGAAANRVDLATGETIDDLPKVVGMALDTATAGAQGTVLINVGRIN